MRLVRRGRKKPDSFWCDTLVPEPDGVRIRSVEVAAPPKLVYRWLCQLRVASYSYEWADAARRRSPRELMPGLDELELGQPMMGVYELAHFVPGRELTVRLDAARMADHHLAHWYTESATTYRVVAEGRATTRLVAKSVTAFPGGLRWRLARVVVKRVDAVILKRQLETLKRLAERDQARELRRSATVDELPLHVLTLPARKQSVAN